MNCSACGAANPPTNRFCGQCGARLGDAPAPAPDAPESEREAERRQLTLMFCDLVGSTALSARLDPEDLREVMQAYRDTAVEAIARYDGSVAKFLGDGILAYFGYPRAHDDDAVRAVSAGLAIVETMPALEARVGRPRGVEIRCRIGIATGPVVVGEMGEGDQRESMAVIGEAPNLADRLQSLAAHNSVVVSALTRQLIEHRFSVIPLGSHWLRGLARPVEAFRVTGRSTQGLSGGPRLPLTGRDEELNRLHAAFGEVRAGRGRAITLSGEPGIGKSRLIRALKNEAVPRRRLWLEAQCSPLYADAPFQPAIELLSRALGFRRSEAPEERLHRLEVFAARIGLPADPHIPLLAAMLSLSVQGRHSMPGLSPQALRSRTLGTVVEVLARLAARRPMVLAVEDLHWADESTLDFIEALLASLHGLPILALFTYRPEFTRPWPERAPIEHIVLNRLSAADCSRLIGHVSAGEALPPAVVSGILARSDGVPLFVEEITRTVIDVLRQGKGAERQSELLDAVEIPATLKDSLMARLDRLGEAKDVAQAAAAIGRSFAYELLSGISELEEDELRRALRELEAAGLIQRRGEPPAAIYTFRHALIREIAYDSMLRRRRHVLHGAIAHALEAHFPETVETQPDLLGRHFVQAGEEDRAIGYFERAGRRAAARSAHVEAVRHFQRAIELIDKIEDASPQLERKAGLWSALAPSLLVTRGYGSAEVGDAFRRADELNRRLGIPERLFFSGWGIAAYKFVVGDLKGTLEMLERVEGDAAASGRDLLRSLAIMSRGVALFSLGRYGDCLTQVQHGLSLYDPVEGQALVARLGQDVSVLGLSFAAIAAWGLGRPDEALELARRGLESARASRHAYSLTVILTVGVPLVHFRRGDVAEALAALDEAITIGRENQFPYFLARAIAMRGLIETRTGEVAAGLAHLREGIEAFRARGGLTTAPMMQVWLADGLLSANEPAAARAELHTGLELVAQIGETSHLAEIHRLLGRAALALGDAEEAERAFQRAYDTADEQGAFGWRLRAALDLGDLVLATGRQAQAAKIVETALGAVIGGASTRDVRSARAFLASLESSALSGA